MLFSQKLLETNPYGNRYAIVRSLAAISTLITLLFNSTNVLFDLKIFELYEKMGVFNNINLAFVLGYENILIFKWIGITVMILVIAGIYPRVTGILHFLIAYSFIRSSAILEGGDQMNLIISFFLVPITLMDNRKSHWSLGYDNVNKYKRLSCNCIYAILAIQIAIVYLHAGIEKIYKLDEWTEGTAIYYIFNDVLFGTPDWLNFIVSPVINWNLGSFILSWGTIFFEILLFAGYFMTVNQKLRLFVFGIFFHIIIAVMFGLVSFLFSMAAALSLYLLPNNVTLSKCHFSFVRKLSPNSKS